LKISNEYINSNPQISPAQKATFLLEAVTESDSKLYQALIDQKKEAINAASVEVFEATVRKAAMTTVEKAIEYDFKDLLDEAISNYKLADLGNDKRFTYEAQLKYYQLDGDWVSWKEMNQKYLKKFGKEDPSIFLNQLSVLKNAFSFKKEATDYACDVCKEMVKKSDTVDNYSSYIQTLMECKKYELARKITNEAIKKAKKRDEDIVQFERILKYLDTI